MGKNLRIGEVVSPQGANLTRYEFNEYAKTNKTGTRDHLVLTTNVPNSEADILVLNLDQTKRRPLHKHSTTTEDNVITVSTLNPIVGIVVTISPAVSHLLRT